MINKTTSIKFHNKISIIPSHNNNNSSKTGTEWDSRRTTVAMP